MSFATYAELPGFAARYDRFRPAPPPELLDVLVQLAGARPRLVVDLGAGTGLSTAAWSGRADRIVGVEPDPSMRTAARRAHDVEYRDATAEATGLDDGCADVVTCSQSFHWREPEETLAEAARILRPGGVFAAYDYDLPPTVGPEIESALADVLARTRGAGGRRHPKDEHLARVRDSGRFAYVRETCLHAWEPADAERLVGLVCALGTTAARLHAGATVTELGLDRLRETAERRIVPGETKLWWSYRVRIGVT